MVQTTTMDLRKWFERLRPIPGLIGIERIMFCYSMFTMVLLCLFYDMIVTPVSPFGWNSPMAPIVWRLFVMGITLLLWLLYRCFPCNATYVVRVYFQLAMLAFWYPDIYNMAQLMPNYDYIFASLDQFLFGFQPALRFSEWLSGRFWNELFHMGYFSYYLMLIVVTLWATTKNFRRFDKTTTIIFCSFILFYCIYLFLQSAGPQFYFQKIGIDSVEAGIFPKVGDYFRYHPELIHHDAVPDGLFVWLVESAQKSEYPIAAFPSSHVGLATIMIWLAYKMSRRLAMWMLPFYIILCLSTVYIGAHYAIDVFGGWIMAAVIYHISLWIYRTKFIHRPKAFDAYHRYRGGRHYHRHGRNTKAED